jgi:hypothetical protein
MVRNGSERLKGCFCVRNGSVTPTKEKFVKQMQITLLGGWFADDTTAVAYPLSIKLEAFLRRYSWKKVLQICSRISYGLDGRRRSPNHDIRDMISCARSWSAAC